MLAIKRKKKINKKLKIKSFLDSYLQIQSQEVGEKPLGDAKEALIYRGVPADRAI